MVFLRESPQADDSIEALSARVYLSHSRLFKKVIGVPVHRYVILLKMRHALDLAIANNSLPNAALSAGFADSTHLSRNVRMMTRIAPDFLFRQRKQLIIYL